MHLLKRTSIAVEHIFKGGKKRSLTSVELQGLEVESEAVPRQGTMISILPAGEYIEKLWKLDNKCFFFLFLSDFCLVALDLYWLFGFSLELYIVPQFSPSVELLIIA